MNRKRQKLLHIAVDLFVELLYQVTGNRVNYRCNDNDITSFDLFVDEYGENIGENFIREFAEYGMQSWFNSGSKRDVTHSIRFNWIFGAAAVKRWDALPGHARTRIVRKNLKTNTKINTIKRKSSVAELVLTVRKVEENFKAQFYNTKRGYAWCLANTSLYFHKSNYCAGCIFKDDCKEALKKNYPRTYKTRGYGE